MNFSIFVHPMEAVQVRSIFSYLILLSDFLFSQKLLNSTDLNKPIPVVNAMYTFLIGEGMETIDTTKLENLAKYLIRNSDLYGSKEGEILDPHFTQSLFNHIINSLVFEKYGNVYGFIAEVIRTSNDTTQEEVLYSLFLRLSTETFKNENGPDSKLAEASCIRIIQEFISPLFPRSNKNLDIFSIDHMYAQAGSLFFRSISKTRVDPDIYTEFENQMYRGNIHFDEYVRVAHVVEQLVTMKKIDNSALRIFAVPAFLHYLHEKQEDLPNETIEKIINNQTVWETAFKHFFLNLSDFLETVDEVQDEDYRYKLILALQNYESKSSLARSNLERNCPTLSKDVLEDKVKEYLECTADCFCSEKGNRINLTSVDTLFKDQFNSTLEKYTVFERESLRRVFADKIKPLIDSQKVVVKKGLFENSYIADLGPLLNNAMAGQSVPDQNDILEFYFPDTKNTIYYGLIRKDLKVFLINETSDKYFKQKLGLYRFTRLLSWKFTTVLKQDDENFDDFLTKITKERVGIFEKDLRNYKTEEKKQPWWKGFLLSLIPFYNCAQAIKEKNVELTEMACSLDITFFVPGAVEVSMALKKLTTATSEAFAKVSLSSIKTATSRLSFRVGIKSGGGILMDEVMKFIESFTPRLFKNLGVSVLRLVDPGFELLYSLGKGGLSSIRKLVTSIEKKYPGSFSLIQETLNNAVNGMVSATKMITEKLESGVYKNKEVYVNTLKENSGYGYNFIHLSEEKILPLRTVEEYADKFPVFSSVGNIKYEGFFTHKLNSEAGRVVATKVHLVHGVELTSAEREFTIRFKDVHGELPCSEGRIRRSPDEELPCFRTSLMNQRDAREEEAAQIATTDGALTRIQVQDEFRKYLFLEESEKTELDFMNDWKRKNFLEIPEWSKEYKIKLPEVYNQLRYNTRMSELEIPIHLKDNPIIHEYDSSKAYKHLSFEDYDNIHKYMGIYYGQVAANTELGMSMRKSLYRLAIRQSDDPVEEYATILYRGERRLNDAIDDLFYPLGKEFEFTKFTSTSTDDFSASFFRQVYSHFESEVEYVLHFDRPYLRANVERVFVYSYEKETILLPGSKFIINAVKKGVNERGIHTVSVEMSHVPESKFESIKSVMNELNEIEKVEKMRSYW